MKGTEINARPVPLALAAAILVLALAPQLYKLFLPVKLVFSGFVSDDAFYYYKTALNIHNGLGSTFDGQNFTNGYHPLWMLCCAALTFITADPRSYLYLALAANLLFVLLLTRQVFNMFAGRLGLFFAAALACLMNWNYMSSTAYFSGMETPLYLWLTLLAVDKITKISWTDKMQCAGLGLLLGLCFLARTEFVLFLPVFFLYLALRLKGRAAAMIAPLFFIFVPFTLLAAPYLIWNYHMTGHFEQVSGLVKSLKATGGLASASVFARGLAAYALKIMEAVALRPAPGSLILVPLLYPFAYYARGLGWRLPVLNDHRILILAGFAAVGVAYYFVSYGDQFRYWHFAPAFLALQIVFVHLLKGAWDAAAAVKPLRRLLKAVMIVAGTALFLQMPWFSYMYHYQKNYHFTAPVYYQDEAARWIRDNLPADARIGVWDAGYVGYFSGHEIVNLDGLINGMGLYAYLADGRGVYRYILDQRLDYISNYYFGEPRPLRSDLAPKLRLVYHVGRSDVARDGKPTCVDWYVWKIEY